MHGANKETKIPKTKLLKFDESRKEENTEILDRFDQILYPQPIF